MRETSLTGERTEVHVFRDWCWLATVRDESELNAVREVPPRGEFDLDIYRLLVRRLPRARPMLLEPLTLAQSNAS